MARRAAISLLVVTQQRLVRADFDGAGRGPTHVYEADRPTIDDHAGLVETTIRLGPALGRSVWLLSTEVFTQTVEVPMGTVSGVSDEELAKALSFEAEALSNINAFDSAVGHLLLGTRDGHRQYLVCQMQGSELAQIDELVRRADARLAGVTHPAGAPAPLAGGSPGEWHRVELWPDSIVCVGATSASEVSRLTLHADPRTAAWIAYVERWMTDHGAGGERELLSPDDFDIPDTSTQRIRSLRDTSTRDAWLTCWASSLDGDLAGVPVVRPAKRPMSSSGRFAIAALFAIFAMAACYGHHLWLTTQKESLEREVQLVLGPVQQLTKVKSEADKVANQVNQQKAVIAALDQDIMHLTDGLDVERRR
ncbi:MAG: hypothetical protein AAFX05_06700, partial [Planctomycetota bacterium]